MELEVPDEAESAEAGAVTAEAAWSAESGAEAGKSKPPSLRWARPAPPPRRSGLARWLRAALRPAGLFHSHTRRGGERARPFRARGEAALGPEAAPPHPRMRGSQRTAGFRVLG